MEVSSERVICTRCGIAFPKRRGNFLVNHSALYKGIGTLSICKKCLDDLYSIYLSQSKDRKMAVRQVCRKLDLYWDEDVFRQVANKSTPRSIMSQYVQRINSGNFVGLSYDDTLLAEGHLWSFGKKQVVEKDDDDPGADEPITIRDVGGGDFEVTDDIISYWGVGYRPSVYAELEQRRRHYMSKFPEGTELEVGSDALLKQICNLEMAIARDAGSDKAIDRNINSLNTLLGSLNLKPAQKKEATVGLEGVAMGEWIKRWEDEEPIPEYGDKNEILRQVHTWFYGHTSKMLNIKNAYSRMYDEEMERLRVESPDPEDDDDDIIYNLLSDPDGDDEDLFYTGSYQDE